MSGTEEIAERIRKAAVGQSRSGYEEAQRIARMKWNQIQHPLDGLGLLEDHIVQIAGLTRNAEVSLDKKAAVIFFSDNGVVAEGISQIGSEVTGIVALRMAEGKTSVCQMARIAGADVIPVDMGIRDFAGKEGILNRRIANGTGNLLHASAMTREQAEQAILTGIDLACRLSREGYRLLAAGEMGIGNTTTASACASALLGKEPSLMTGKGAGLSEEGLRHKVKVVEEAIRRNGLNQKEEPDCTDGILPDTLEIMRRVGGFDLLGMCGLYIGGWISQIPVLIDGFASSVAALSAVRICPRCAEAMLASHESSEPAAGIVLNELGKKPLIRGNLHLGEGTGAVLAMPMLDMALSVYRDCVRFGEGGVKQYRRL